MFLSSPFLLNICYIQFKRTLLQTAILELQHFRVGRDLSPSMIFYKSRNQGTGIFHGLPKATPLLRLEPRLPGSLLTALSAQLLHVASKQEN